MTGIRLKWHGALVWLGLVLAAGVGRHDALAFAPRAGTKAPVGFGAGTSGGAGGSLCQWRDEATLRACVTAPGSTIAQAVGDPVVRLLHDVRIGSNKTLFGPATITASNIVMLEIRHQSNVIVHGIKFVGDLAGNCAEQGQGGSPAGVKRCGVPISIIDAVSHVWLDQDGFDRCGEKCLEIWSLGPGRTPDAITVSNSTFSNSYFCAAVGVSAHTAVPPPGSERVTFLNNTFDHCYRRSVRAASGAWVHEIDNVIKDWGPSTGPCRAGGYGFGPSSVGGAQLLLEGNTFIAGPVCKEAVNIAGYHVARSGERGAGAVRAGNNRTENGATVKESLRAAVFTPPYRLNR
jgi:pectate lyase